MGGTGEQLGRKLSGKVGAKQVAAGGKGVGTKSSGVGGGLSVVNGALALFSNTFDGKFRGAWTGRRGG